MGFNSGFKGLISHLLVQIHIGMTNVKLIASQAHLVNQYRNIRSKLQKCCAIIYFNKQ